MTSDPVKHILSQFGKRQMTTTPQSLAENEGVAANVEDPRVAAIAEAMRQKRKDLIHQPLAFIWDDLARAALSALRSRDSVIDAPAAYLLENRAYGKELSFKPLDAMRGPGWEQTPLYSLSSHAETAGGWRPIETAPKDGTKVLAIMPGHFQSVVWYDDQFSYDYNEETGESDYRGAWTDGTVASFAYEEIKELHPTHWMPLPPPPQSPAMIKAAKGGEI